MSEEESAVTSGFKEGKAEKEDFTTEREIPSEREIYPEVHIEDEKGTLPILPSCNKGEPTVDDEDGRESEKEKPHEKGNTGYDVVFALDCTESMKPHMKSAKEVISFVIDNVASSDNKNTKARFGLIQYRDHKPNDKTFVTKVQELTSPESIKTLLHTCRPAGGGDMPEAVADALHDMLHINWRRNTRKVAILVADAPPHGLVDKEDRYPKGCPEGIDPLAVAEEMAERGITLHVIGCEPSIVPFRKFYKTISSCTGGTYISLNNAKQLVSYILSNDSNKCDQGNRHKTDSEFIGQSDLRNGKTRCMSDLPDICQTSGKGNAPKPSTMNDRKDESAPVSDLYQTFSNGGFEHTDDVTLFSHDQI